jgi:hypothetical protein
MVAVPDHAPDRGSVQDYAHKKRKGRAVLMLSLSRLEVGRLLWLRRLLANHVQGPQLNLTMGNFLTMNRISIPGRS